MPQSSNCGAMTTGMNCTAWNSVRANALHSSPSPTPRIALTMAMANTSAGLPAVSRPNSQNETMQAKVACAAAAIENAVP